MSRVLALVCAGVLLVPVAAPAGEGTTLGVRVGLGARGEDVVAEAALLFWHASHEWELSLTVPVTLVLDDRPPVGPTWGALRVPRTQYDSANDVAGWIHRLRIGPDDDTNITIARLLDERLGAGALMDGYYSGLDPDEPSVAFVARYLGARGDGFALYLVDPFYPSLVAGRVHVRPLRLVSDDAGVFDGLELGLEAGVDPTAPHAGQDNGVAVQSEEPYGTADFDVGWDLRLGEQVTLRPYAALAYLSPGLSAHAGLAASFEGHLLAQVARLRVHGDVFTHRAGSWAVPFDAFYSLERRQFPLDVPGAPGRRDALAGAALGAYRLGGRAALEATWEGHGLLAAAFLYEAARSDLTLRLEVSPLTDWSLALIVLRRVYGDEARLLSGSGVTIVAAESAYKVWGPLSVYARFQHWLRRAADGSYVVVTDWTGGAGWEYAW